MSFAICRIKEDVVMSDMKYTYAVARIRALEPSLFSKDTIAQLMGCRTKQQCLTFLSERNWGSVDTPMDVESILVCEKEKTWEVIRSLVEDMSVFDVLLYPDLFHNLKAAIKKLAGATNRNDIFIANTSPSGDELFDIISQKEFHRLPKNMEEPARKALEVLVHTGDGQLCDIIIDQATLKAIYEAGKVSEEKIVKQYAETTVAVANIKIAVRAYQTAKTIDFMKQSMSPCDTLDIQLLARAALKGMAEVQTYLEGTIYAEGAQTLAESPSIFECWCDNQIMKMIQPQIHNPFSVGPLMAYLLARENEIKTVRIILSGKFNELSEDSIRERVRDMYV